MTTNSIADEIREGRDQSTKLLEFRVHRALRGRSHRLPRRDSKSEGRTQIATQELSDDQLSATVATDKGILSLLILSFSLPNTSSFASPVASPEREGVSSPLKTEIPKSAAAAESAASLGEASSHRFSPSLLPSTTQRLAGCFPPSPLTSSFPFCRSSPRSTSASRFFLPFGRLLPLSLSSSRSDERRRSLFFPSSLSLCSTFLFLAAIFPERKRRPNGKWECRARAGGGREASDSRREGLDKQTCAVRGLQFKSHDAATSSAPVLSPVSGLDVMSVVHTLRHRRLWILRQGDRDGIRDDHATCSCYPSTTASLATAEATAATAAYNFSLSAARSETNLPCLASLLAMLRPQQRQHGERPS